MSVRVYLLVLGGLGVSIALKDGPGKGVAKSTYASTEPFAGKEFLLKYFPLRTESDDCSKGVCDCEGGEYTNDEDWEIQQGRASLDETSGEYGFGLHLVNLTARLTTGGVSIAQVENTFTTRLNAAASNKSFDAFMDYNVAIYTSELNGYKAALDADAIASTLFTWQDAANESWYSLILQVPQTQMVLELISQNLTTTDQAIYRARLGNKKIKALKQIHLNSTTFMAIRINRATTDISKVDSFYSTIFQANATIDTSKHRHCYQLSSTSTVDVCYTEHTAASAFDHLNEDTLSVAEFEAGMNAVHATLLEDWPTCGLDNWLDNHFAFDDSAHDPTRGNAIVDYIDSDANEYYFYCEVSNNAPQLHYIIDPAGWGIQLDLVFSQIPIKCVSKLQEFNGPNPNDNNPACALGTCATSKIF